MQIPITKMRKNLNIIGITYNNHIYLSPRKKKEHFFRKFNGYGISKQILNALETQGVKHIILLIDRHGFFETTLENYLTHGINWTFENEDEQLILPIEHFKTPEDEKRKHIYKIMEENELNWI